MHRLRQNVADVRYTVNTAKEALCGGAQYLFRITGDMKCESEVGVG